MIRSRRAWWIQESKNLYIFGTNENVALVVNSDPKNWEK